jgi:hypothetical protein
LKLPRPKLPRPKLPRLQLLRLKLLNPKLPKPSLLRLKLLPKPRHIPQRNRPLSTLHNPSLLRMKRRSCRQGPLERKNIRLSDGDPDSKLGSKAGWVAGLMVWNVSLHERQKAREQETQAQGLLEVRRWRGQIHAVRHSDLILSQAMILPRCSREHLLTKAV